MSDDEFRFLAGDAVRAGLSGPPPRVERVRVPATEGRGISGLAFRPDEPPAVVALHGAGLNAHSFDPTLLALGAPALALDLPGHGRSDWRDDADYRPERLAPDVIAALERLAARPVALVGHSLGGLAAALAAAERPDLVRRLVVIDITPSVSPSGEAGAVAEFITGRRDYGTIDEIVDRAIEFGIGSDRAALTRGVALNTRRRPDGRLEWTHHFAHLDALPGGSGSGAERSARAARADGNGTAGSPRPYAAVWDALAALATPPALVRASRGIVSDALLAEWVERLPGGEVVEIAGPHNLHEAAPSELAGALRRLIA